MSGRGMDVLSVGQQLVPGTILALAKVGWDPR